MAIIQNLRNEHVLVAHEDPFQTSYLCEVIRAAGADVYALTKEKVEGHDLSLLKTGSCTNAIVLSYTLPKVYAIALADAAIASGVNIVVVHLAPAEIEFPFSDYRCLATPYEGTEVVDALIDVLAARRGCIHWSTHASYITSDSKFSGD